MKKIVSILLLGMIAFELSAQSRMREVPSTQEGASGEPFNLPNTIIYGTQRNKVASLEKRMPNLQYRLPDNILDSINSLEKQTPMLLPLPPLPNEIPQADDKIGYIKAGIGSFVTPAAEAGVGFSLGRFDMYLDGSAELSDGHLTDAGYSKFFARLESDYVAEDKFWIFGGSETKTTVMARNNNYNNFVADSAQNISVLDLNADLKTDGSYEGYIFKLQGGVRSMSLITDITGDGTDLGIYGSGLVEGTGNLANFGVETDVALNSYATGNYARLSGGIRWDYFSSKFNLISRIGAVYASPAAGDDIIWPQAKLELNLPLGRVFTVKAIGRTGVEKNSISQLITTNPYLNGESELQFTKNVFGGSVRMLHHPATKFGFMLGGGFDQYENYAFFGEAREATFLASYVDAAVANAFFEAYWTPTEMDQLTGNFTYFYGVTDSMSNSVPYLPDFELEIDYRKELFGFLSLSPELSYVSSRYADIENQEEIESYFDLRLSADAELGGGVVINFEARNLLDNDIYVWNGYRARGLFFNGGVTWRF